MLWKSHLRRRTQQSIAKPKLADAVLKPKHLKLRTGAKVTRFSRRAAWTHYFRFSRLESLVRPSSLSIFSSGVRRFPALRPTRKLSINWAGNRCSGENCYFPHKTDHTVQHWWWRLGLADVRQWEKRWKWRRLWRQRKARNFVCPQEQSTKF